MTAIVVIAFLLRFSFFYFLADYDNINALTWDYINDSNTLLAGKNIFMTSSLTTGKLVLNTTHPKGYAVLLTLFRLVFPNRYWIGMIALQCLADAAVCWMLYKIADQLFHNQTISYTSAVIWAVLPTAIINCNQYLPDAYSCFIMASFILAYNHQYKSLYKKYICIGLLCGVAQYFRSEFMYLWLIAVIADLIRNKMFIKMLLCFFCTCFMVLLVDSPWITYSYKKTGVPLISTTNAWSAAYGAIGEYKNNSIGTSYGDVWLSQIAVSKGFDGPFCIEANKYFKGQFLNYVKTYPMEYLHIIFTYRLPYAFVPTTYARFNLNREYDTASESTYERLAKDTDQISTIQYKIVKQIDGRLWSFEATECQSLSWIVLILNLLFFALNYKEWKKYIFLLLGWLSFPLAISALKQIEPRNVAANLPIMILAASWILVTMSQKTWHALISSGSVSEK